MPLLCKGDYFPRTDRPGSDHRKPARLDFAVEAGPDAT